MNIIEAAIRRILIRGTEKAIVGGAKSLGQAGQVNARVTLPSVPTLIWNIIAMGLLLYLLTIIFIAAEGQLIAYVIPLFFIFRIIRPLRGFTYDVKEEPVYKSDKRYTTGRKITGYRTVTDKTKKIEFNDSQRKLGRIEAALKGVLILADWTYVYLVFNQNFGQ